MNSISNIHFVSFSYSSCRFDISFFVRYSNFDQYNFCYSDTNLGFGYWNNYGK